MQITEIKRDRHGHISLTIKVKAKSGKRHSLLLKQLPSDDHGLRFHLIGDLTSPNHYCDSINSALNAVFDWQKADRSAARAKL